MSTSLKSQRLLPPKEKYLYIDVSTHHSKKDGKEKRLQLRTQCPSKNSYRIRCPFQERNNSWHCERKTSCVEENNLLFFAFASNWAAFLLHPTQGRNEWGEYESVKFFLGPELIVGIHSGKVNTCFM